jgi:hypothetical protein
MKLPSIDTCPQCCSQSRRLFREEPESSPLAHRRDPKEGHRGNPPMTCEQARISVYDHLGTVNEDNSEHRFEQEVDTEFQKDTDNKKEPASQWCPIGIFCRSQKRRA